MRVLICLTLILSTLKIYSQSKDSLRFKNHFIELKPGAVFFLRGEGNWPGQKDKVKSRLSESFNITMGRRIGNWLSFGFGVDYTKYNLVGDPKIVGYYLYKSHIFNSYLISQDMSYYNLSMGTSATFNIKIRKISLDFGPSFYLICYQSPMTVKNHYVGEQPAYPNIYKLPEEGTAFKVRSGYDMETFPYVGLSMNLSYKIGHLFSVKVFNTFFYNLDVQLYQNGTYMDSSTLPQNYVYGIETQYWLNSGVAISFFF